MLGPPVKHEGSSVDRDYDMRKGVLGMRHGPDIRGQVSAEPPLIARPPNQASASLMPQPFGGGLVEDDITNRTQTNNWSIASGKESSVVKSDKHQAQLKPFSHSVIGSPPNVVHQQASQLKTEEVCQQTLCCLPIFYYVLSGLWNNVKFPNLKDCLYAGNFCFWFAEAAGSI